MFEQLFDIYGLKNQLLHHFYLLLNTNLRYNSVLVGRRLRLAASLERGSEHPLAEAIVSGAIGRGVELGKAENFESITGKGVTGDIDTKRVALGNRGLLESLGIDPGDLVQRAELSRAEGQTVMFVAIDGAVSGIIGVADPIKETTPEAIKNLQAEGVQVVMLTGDSETTARAVAENLAWTRLSQACFPSRRQRL